MIDIFSLLIGLTAGVILGFGLALACVFYIASKREGAE